MMGADQYLLQHVVDVTALGIRARRAALFRDARLGRLHRPPPLRRASTPRLAEDRASACCCTTSASSAIPQEILDKPGTLNDEEWDDHAPPPAIGRRHARRQRLVPRPRRRPPPPRALDGSGYPDGLAGDQIHQFARIAAVADVYDAVTSERVYKAAAAAARRRRDHPAGRAAPPSTPRSSPSSTRSSCRSRPATRSTSPTAASAVVVDVDVALSRTSPHVRVRNDDGSVEEIERAVLAVHEETRIASTCA